MEVPGGARRSCPPLGNPCRGDGRDGPVGRSRPDTPGYPARPQPGLWRARCRVQDDGGGGRARRRGRAGSPPSRHRGIPVSARLACVMLADAAINVLPARMPAAGQRAGSCASSRWTAAIRRCALPRRSGTELSADLDNAPPDGAARFHRCRGASDDRRSPGEGGAMGAHGLGETPRGAGAGNRSGGRAGAGLDLDRDGRTRRTGKASAPARGWQRCSAAEARCSSNVLLTPNPNGIWMAVRELEATGLGLQPDAGDFAGLLKAGAPACRGRHDRCRDVGGFSGTRESGRGVRGAQSPIRRLQRTSWSPKRRRDWGSPCYRGTPWYRGDGEAGARVNSAT